ncbi:hypothetical protein [Parasphingorhabdus sp.]|uniref:hypothetical protein n=1 Tax=Parasphingorhabdus sp. TaxID=2709688 RepID=UPI003002FF0E
MACLSAGFFYERSKLMTNPTEIEQQLAREANLFSARGSAGNQNRTRTYIVADFEYGYDRDRYNGYRTAEGTDAEKKIRWPFHRIAAASWCVMRFKQGSDAPEIEGPVVLSADDHSEKEMVSAFFDALDEEPGAVLVTWGGEHKDLAVLRRTAGELDLIMPGQLRDLSPISDRRIDLCGAVSIRTESVHLPEYAAACSIPAKPSPSKSIGDLVEKGKWEDVEEQVLADVMTTAIIMLRHLKSHGLIRCAIPACSLALANAATSANPDSEFLRRTFKPWAQLKDSTANYTCPIYRAA